MTEKNQIYKCSVCGNIVEVTHTGVGQLVCCGKPMELMAEKTQDAGLEKHVPIIEATADGVKIKVGAVAHPMEEAHYIEWIEIIADEKIYRTYLAPGQSPEAVFSVKANKLQARIYCNIHGLWRSV